jgi:hypothetical protein
MPKLRTMYYRRAHWLGVNNVENLQTLVDRIHHRLNTTQSRTLLHKDGQLQGINISHRGRPRCSLIHVAYYVPRQPTSLVPDPAPIANGNTVERAPPDRHSFMDGDIFLLLRENDIVLCNSGAREGAAKAYLAGILSAGGVEDVFEVEQVADVDKVELVQREGVKSIRLSSSVFKATTDRIQRETKKTRLMGVLADEIMRLYAAQEEANLDDLAKYENLQVKLEISFDSRKKGGELAAGKLDEAAQGLLNEDDKGFVIVTKEGNALTSDDIKVKKVVEVDDHGNSVSCEHAWREMLIYYGELRAAGVVED